ncbi:MAG TPA: DUF1501 domain-containing protein [Pirellulales bacterium]|jgi:hypothetical protein|nr:DUF1501 domain-containing protein [Pirellulales bacterium]
MPARFRRDYSLNRLSRRELVRFSAAGVVGASSSGWLEGLAAQTAALAARRRACMLLWMSGGPSQLETFDPKPNHENGGPVKAIDTSVPGIRISEYLPRVARQMDEMAIVRSMSTKEGDHTRATYMMRTGYLPQGPVHYPTLGSLLSKKLGEKLGSGDAELPNFVSIAPLKVFSPGAFEAGFLGPQYAPLDVGQGQFPGAQVQDDAARQLQVENLGRPGDVSGEQFDARLALLGDMERDFSGSHPGVPPQSHQAAYEQAVRMMRSDARTAFRLELEPPTLRDAYGRNGFGQGCLLARRLVERGVPFVEVSLNGVAGNQFFGWDTHANNFESVKKLTEVLDPAWATLMSDLKSRGLLDSTLIVWMGEFGRTPRINGSQGRDHYPAAWSAVLAGGPIKGGQVVGRTGADGMRVEDRPVAVADLLSTVCLSMGIDPMEQNMSNVGRPIRITSPDARPIQELLA